MKAGTFKVEENIELITSDHWTGEVKERSVVKNAIVNSGLERIAKLLNNESSTYYRAIAIGTDNTAVTNSDTTLGTEVARETATLSYEADYKAKFSHKFTFGSGESYTITEVGVFDSATASGSTMLNRALDAGKSVDSDTDLTVTVTITIARA